MRRNDESGLRSVERLGDDLERAFARVERIEAAGAPVDAHDPRRTASRRSRRRVYVAALAGAVSIFVVSAIVISAGGRREAPLTTQEALADVARSMVSVPLPTARQFVFTHVEQIFMAGSRNGGRDHLGRKLGWLHYDEKTVTDTWSSTSRCGLSRTREVGRDYPTGRDRELARRYDAENLYLLRRANRLRRARGLAPLPKVVPSNEMVVRIPASTALRLGSETFTATELRRFPERPQTIYRLVRRATSSSPSGRIGGGATGELMSIVETLGSDFGLHVTPAARAGIVRSLAFIPGVKSLGLISDPRGRIGHGFELQSQRIATTVIFDRASGFPIFTRAVVLKTFDHGPYKDWPAGNVVNQQLVIERKIVDRLPHGHKPTLTAGLRCR